MNWKKRALEAEAELKDVETRIWDRAIKRLKMTKPENIDSFNYQYIIADFEKARTIWE